jgi:hypothetical protein
MKLFIKVIFNADVEEDKVTDFTVLKEKETIAHVFDHLFLSLSLLLLLYGNIDNDDDNVLDTY